MMPIIAFSLLALIVICIIAANIWQHKELSKMTPEQVEEDKKDLRYEARIW